VFTVSRAVISKTDFTSLFCESLKSFHSTAGNQLDNCNLFMLFGRTEKNLTTQFKQITHKWKNAARSHKTQHFTFVVGSSYVT